MPDVDWDDIISSALGGTLSDSPRNTFALPADDTEALAVIDRLLQLGAQEEYQNAMMFIRMALREALNREGDIAYVRVDSLPGLQFLKDSGLLFKFGFQTHALNIASDAALDQRALDMDSFLDDVEFLNYGPDNVDTDAVEELLAKRIKEGQGVYLGISADWFLLKQKAEEVMDQLYDEEHPHPGAIIHDRLANALIPAIMEEASSYLLANL